LLRKCLAGNPPLEVRQRVTQLLKRLQMAFTQPQQMQRRRAVEVLEHIGTPEARQLLEKIAHGAPEALLTQEVKVSLERLAKRFPDKR
jgi:hypothetical protein